MFEFLDEFAPENSEQISKTRADKIKASVLSKLENDDPDKYDKEEIQMKKHFSIKPFLIAAAVAVTGAVSVVSAGAAENTNISEFTLPDTGAVQTNVTAPNDQIKMASDPDLPTGSGKVFNQVNNVQTQIKDISGEIKQSIEEYDGYLRAAGSDTGTEIGGLPEPFEIADSALLGELNLVDDEECCEAVLNKADFLYEESDGTRHYKTPNGGNLAVRFITNTVDKTAYRYFVYDYKADGSISALIAIS